MLFAVLCLQLSFEELYLYLAKNLDECNSQEFMERLYNIDSYRRLRCLVAIELKWTEFLPEYVGKMNFYLSALDDLVRLPNENPSIGIILCRGQKQRTVEYALRDTRKPMGVATYRAANELPEEYGEVLGGLEGLKELM